MCGGDGWLRSLCPPSAPCTAPAKPLSVPCFVPWQSQAPGHVPDPVSVCAPGSTFLKLTISVASSLTLGVLSCKSEWAQEKKEAPPRQEVY